MRDWAGFGQNRVFTMIALGLVGLLILGLLGIGGLIFFTRLRGPATPTVVAELTPTATPTKAPTATPTKAPTATSTKVPTATPAPVVSPSPTPVVTPTPTPTEEGVPETGWGPLEGALVGSFLAILILVSRRLRFAGRS
jgi:cell division septation protein DedD